MKDLDQKIPSFSNFDNYRICRASNPHPLNDDTKTNDNELHQQLCVTFKIDYLQEMDIITKVKARLECKINVTLLALLPNKVVQDSRGPVTSGDKAEHEEHSTRSKRTIPLLAMHDPSSRNCAIFMSTLVSTLNSTELHLQGVAPRSQYSDPMPEVVTLQ